MDLSAKIELNRKRTFQMFCEQITPQELEELTVE